MKQEIIFSKDKYFEAVIQLRPETEEVLRFIQNQLAKRKDVLIARIVRADYGIDIYLTSQRFARALGKKLKKSFKGTLKMSRQLFTKNTQTSKDVYRVTVLFRLQPKEDVDAE